MVTFREQERARSGRFQIWEARGGAKVAGIDEGVIGTVIRTSCYSSLWSRNAPLRE